MSDGRTGKRSVAAIDRALRQAEWMIGCGACEAALAKLRTVFEADASHSKARLMQARACLAMGEAGMAMAALDIYEQRAGQALDQDATDRLRAQALCAMGKAADAVQIVDALVARQPGAADVLQLAGGVYIAAGETEKAKIVFRGQLALKPDDAEAALMLADLWLEAGGQGKHHAIDLLIEAATNTQEAMARAQLLHAAAEICTQANRWADAETFYQQAADEMTPTAELWLSMARVADVCGHRPMAVKRIERASELKRLNSAQCREAAQVLMHAGDWGRAGWMWWKITQEKPYDVTAWAGLLICAQLTGHGKLRGRAHRKLSLHAAEAERRDALALMWQDAAVGQAVAKVIEDPEPSRQEQDTALGRMLHRAANVLSGAAADHPQHADAHYHQAMCEHARGRDQAARKAVNRALAINPNYVAAKRLQNELAQPQRVA